MVHLTGEAKVAYIQRLFSRIAGRYDLLNSMMTGRAHYRWKNLTTGLATDGIKGQALDVATGTGDLAFRLAAYKGIHRVIGLDFALPMLAIAQRRMASRRKGAPICFILADALNLPFPSDSFACITTGFSLRNVTDIGQALKEAHRVMTPNGRLCILETTPLELTGLFSRFFRFYFHWVVPLLGAILAGDREAYTYLPRSVDRFPNAKLLAQMMGDAGFNQVTYTKVGMGTVAIHQGIKS